jgi:hypothetical protein
MQTDMMKLTVTLPKFAIAPKIYQMHAYYDQILLTQIYTLLLNIINASAEVCAPAGACTSK